MLRVVGETPACSIGATRGLCVARFWHEIGEREAEAFHDRLREVAALGGGFALLVVVGPHAPPPKGPVRALLTDALAEVRQDVTMFAGVVEGDGLSASVKRTIMRVILVLSRVRYPTHIEGSVESAIEKLGPALPDVAKAERLAGFCAEHLYPTRSTLVS